MALSAKPLLYNYHTVYLFTQSILNYLEHRTPVTLETDGLLVRAVSLADKPFFRDLFLDPKVMKNFTDHKARYKQLTPDQWREQQVEAADKRVVQLVQRWIGGDPFSGFVIIDKSSGEPRAHVTAGHTNPPTPGKTEVAYMVPRDRWHEGYGTFSFSFILNYLEMLKLIYFEWREHPLAIDGAPFDGIIAASHRKNEFSIKIIEKKMKKKGEEERWSRRFVVYQCQVGETKPKL